jgi:fructan beta-fructosidase
MTPKAQTTSYTEIYRPQYHFSPESGWMNDPNGLVYYKGEYHLFYQYYPFATHWSTMHWGHAVSPDLIHWEHLPIALYPETIGPIFSGSAVVDEHNWCGLVPGGGLVAIFSYQDQSQGIAYSQDDGRTWTMYSGNPVIPTPGGNFRDPKVFWHVETQQWIMVIAADDRIKIYSSPDLISWTYLSEFGSDQGSHGGVWECPDLFPLQIDDRTRWVMIVSIGTGAVFGGSGTQYFVGDFDGVKFTNENPASSILWLDYGRDNYAAVTWNNTPERLLIGWMNNWQYAAKIPTSTWRGAMTIPRQLALRNIPGEGIRLTQTPIEQLAVLRGPVEAWKQQVLSAGTNLLSGVNGKTLEVIAEFELTTASEVGIRVQKSAQHYTIIGYNTRSSSLFVDRSKAGDTSIDAESSGITQTFLAPINQRIKLHILVDWSSVEVFGNDGQVVLTNQIFADADSTQLELYVLEGDVTLIRLDVYQLDGIWHH